MCPKGDITRPATDGLRQAVFSSLADKIGDAVFADLFAGTGTYGLEALSRGASSGTFVERDRQALLCLKNNIAAVAKSMRLDTIPCLVKPVDVDDWQPTTTFDLIFLDPPYAYTREHGDALLIKITPHLKIGGRVVFECPSDQTLTPQPSLTHIRTLGKVSGKNNPCALIFERVS